MKLGNHWLRGLANQKASGKLGISVAGRTLGPEEPHDLKWRRVPLVPAQ